MAAESLSLDQLEVLREMFSMPESTDWLNVNKFETAMLAWMRDIPITNLRQIEGFEARFDFEGYLLPQCVVELNKAAYQYLYHMYPLGDEPERVGYSLQQLLSLSRSDDMQQRIMALNTLANILYIEQTGVYETIIKLPIEQIFFVLKFNLDDNTPSVLTAAIRALRNLVYFQIGETSLDNILCFGMGTIQPILAIDNDMEESEDDDTLNDQQLAEINLVKCLIRTGILARFRYIVNTIKPQREVIVNCIEILIRLARDSEFVIDKILHCKELMSSLIKYSLPPLKSVGLDKSCPEYFMPLPQMIKLLRVLSSRSKNIAASLLNKYDLLNTMISYLSEDHFFQNGTSLQVESLHYWTVVLHYELSIDAYSKHFNVIMDLLDYHFRLTNNDLSTTLITQSHVAALFMLLAKAVEKGHVLFQRLTTECFKKWIRQFGILKEFKCAHSQITTSIFYYAAVCNRYGVNINSFDLLEFVLHSDGFKVATSRILNGSLLLNDFITRQTATNLKTLGAAAWFAWEHIIPVMQTNSCISFLYAFSSFVLSDDSSMLKTKFLTHPNIEWYTKKLKFCSYNFDSRNWFTRCESFLILNILKIAENVQVNIDPDLYYSTAVKCLFMFGAEQEQDLKFLRDNIVFCPRFGYKPKIF